MGGMGQQGQLYSGCHWKSLESSVWTEHLDLKSVYNTFILFEDYNRGTGNPELFKHSIPIMDLIKSSPTIT